MAVVDDLTALSIILFSLHWEVDLSTPAIFWSNLGKYYTKYASILIYYDLMLNPWRNSAWITGQSGTTLK